MHPATEHGMGAVRFRQVLWQPCRGHSPRLTTASDPSAVVRVGFAIDSCSHHEDIRVDDGQRIDRHAR